MIHTLMYSERGVEFAKKCHEKASKKHNATKQSVDLHDAFRDIIKDSRTIEDEKIIARFAIDATENISGYDIKAQCRLAIMYALATPTSGTIGSTIAKVCCEVTDGITGENATYNKEEFLYRGFKAIRENELATEYEKGIAYAGDLGTRSGDGNIIVRDKEERVRLMRFAMNAIKEAPESGPVGKAIAKVCYDTAREASNPGGSINFRDFSHNESCVLMNGLESIKDFTPDNESKSQELARQCIYDIDDYSIDTFESRKAMYKAIGEIGDIKIVMREERARKELDTMADVCRNNNMTKKNSLVIDRVSGTLDIDGVRLDIKKD